MDAAITTKIDQWLNSPIDDSAKAEIRKLLTENKEAELSDAFYKDLEFGTGGLRGLMGIGTNRINKYTIGMATQGLSNYLKQEFTGRSISVAIAHDSRNNSRHFAEVTAAVFSANGIKVFFFEDLRPTPELSFAIRALKCQAGVVITASHNPREYNGYKAYWDDGGQLVSPHDKNVIREVSKIKGIDEVKFEKDQSLIETIGAKIDELYLEKLASLSLAKDAISRQKNLKILYTPIHGSGITLVPKALQRLGFENVTVLESQAKPDGNFPTVVYPNPEETEAMNLALKKAQEIDADLVMATDPDADRVGIAARNQHGEFQLLNGNQTASLLIYYLLSKWKENGKLDGKQYIVKTIVTTDLLEEISKSYGVTYYNTLTGFKYIAQLIRQNEGKTTFIGGGEESYGYLVGEFVRDKDAVVACAIISEMVAYAKDQQKSLFDFLTEIYLKYGFFLEKLISITKKGQSGEQEIKEMMIRLRNNPPATINGSKVIKIADYQQSEEKDLEAASARKIDFPKSDVLQFFTEDGSKISARPSGTEPKIKFYFSVREKLKDSGDYDKINNLLEDRIKAIIHDLGL
jgi:phosphoglucomutase